MTAQDGLPPRRNGKAPAKPAQARSHAETAAVPPDPLAGGPEPLTTGSREDEPADGRSEHEVHSDAPPDDEPLAPGLHMADPEHQHLPGPAIHLADYLPPQPPAPAPGEPTRVCGMCNTRMPISHLGLWADSQAWLDQAACAQRAAQSGMFAQPAERQ